VEQRMLQPNGPGTGASEAKGKPALPVEWSTVYSGEEAQCHVHLLRAGSTYAFRVRARSSEEGAWSEEHFIRTRSAKPPPLGHLYAGSSTASSIQVRFKVPAALLELQPQHRDTDRQLYSVTPPSLSYRIEYAVASTGGRGGGKSGLQWHLGFDGTIEPEDQSSEVRSDSTTAITSRRIDVPGLEADTEYVLRAAVSNDGGQSEWSALLRAHTSAVRGAAAAANAPAAGQEQLAEEPAASAGNDAPLSFKHAKKAKKDNNNKLPANTKRAAAEPVKKFTPAEEPPSTVAPPEPISPATEAAVLTPALKKRCRKAKPKAKQPSPLAAAADDEEDAEFEERAGMRTDASSASTESSAISPTAAASSFSIRSRVFLPVLVVLLIALVVLAVVASTAASGAGGFQLLRMWWKPVAPPPPPTLQQKVLRELQRWIRWGD